MRIALFSRNARPADAIGRQVVAKWNYFRQQGAEVRVYLAESEPLHPALADVIDLPAREIWQSADHRAYLKSCDLILAEFGAAYDLVELLPALAGRGPGIVVDYHGITPPELADPPLYGDIDAARRQRGLLWAADRVIVHSRFAAEELESAIGLPAPRIHRVPCHVPQPGGRGTDPARLRQAHGLASATVLLFVGRLARNKQPELLVQALKRFAPSVHAVFVGPQDDVYAARKFACLLEARRLGVERRVHFLGHTDEADLDGWYRVADVLVVPSAHECFGLPVIEAMARGTPVACADRAALPETLGHAGLTFHGDCAEDLASQVSRYLSPLAGPRANRIALVTHRFGTHFAGGAEASLRRMARALQEANYEVEVFTTCSDHESRWANTLPNGTGREDGFTVHRFRIDPYDPDALGRAYEAILRERGRVEADVQLQFLENSLGSSALLAELEARRDSFAAILVGPYLFKLTHDVASRFGEQVLLVPCFHDEPLAYVPAFREAYRGVGGLLFHSAAEARLTSERLAINHPRHGIVGTVLAESAFQGDPAAGRRRCGEQYLVYCGRYCPEKGLDRLVQFMDQYVAVHGEGLRLVCLGHGPMPLPARAWLTDLGFVEEATKRDVLAGALALVNLSPNESLSIVALEAWALGVPVLVSRGCPVLVDQLDRGQGGACVGSQEEFEEVLNLWRHNPEAARVRGQAGLQFVRREYASPGHYAETLVNVVTSLQRPLRDLAREHGLPRARLCGEDDWRRNLDEVISPMTIPRGQPRGESRERPGRARVDLRPIPSTLTCTTSQPTTTVTLRVINRGDGVLAHRGPARACLVTRVLRGTARPAMTLLTLPLVPGQEQLCVADVLVPRRPGAYRIEFRLQHGKRTLAKQVLPLRVTRPAETAPISSQTPLAPLIDSARTTLADARRLQGLPENYLDVTEGRFSRLKRRIKSKLLNNFRKAYVDVAFRQQSALNRKLIAVMSLLVDTASAAPAAEEAALRGRIDRLEHALRREVRHRRRLQRLLERGRPAEQDEPRLSEGGPV